MHKVCKTAACIDHTREDYKTNPPRPHFMVILKIYFQKVVLHMDGVKCLERSDINIQSLSWARSFIICLAERRLPLTAANLNGPKTIIQLAYRNPISIF